MNIFSPGCCCGHCLGDGEVLFLTDTTGSMSGSRWERTKSIYESVREGFEGPDLRFAVADYKSPGDDGYQGGWVVHLEFTTDWDAVEAALDGLILGGGSGGKEMQFNALKNAADGWETDLSGAPEFNNKRIIMWAGDEEGGEHGLYPSYEEVVQALMNANAEVIGLNLLSEGSGIDSLSQAQDICDASNGTLFNSIDENSWQDGIRSVLCEKLSPECCGGGTPVAKCEVGFENEAINTVMDAGWRNGYIAVPNLFTAEDWHHTDINDCCAIFLGGIICGPVTEIDPTHWTKIYSYLYGGGRVYCRGEWAPCFPPSYQDEFNFFLGAMGSTMRIGNISCSAFQALSTTNSAVPMMNGISSVGYANTNVITGGTWLAKTTPVAGDVCPVATTFLSMEKIGQGYIIACGDSNVETDTDNYAFLASFIENIEGDML